KQEELVLHVSDLLSAPPTEPVFLNGEPVPCQEKVITGDDVDVRALPAHLQNREDGGKCISASICIVKDPDTGQYNLSYHRMMLMGKKQTGFLMLPRHMWKVYKKYEERGLPMPIAAVIGHHPGFALAGGISESDEIDEVRLAGTFLGEPLRMAKAKTIDLEVPADAEIIIEGEIPPKIRKTEGPFGEFQGYYLTGETDSPVFNVKAITMRRDAIYKIVQSAYNTEAAIFHRVPMAVTLWNRLKQNEGGMTIHNINVIPTNFTVIIQMTPGFEGQAKNTLMSALSGGYLHHKVAIAVDEDVDPFDMNDVFFAISTRVNPVRDVVIIPGVRNHVMDPSITMVDPERDYMSKVQSVGSKMIIDATKPSLSHPARERFDRVVPTGWDEFDPEAFFPDEKPW
ncbi:MAG TPA: UbiD family decarboxylase, partial [Nitrospinota bacterium]|nr:UbiD family decarboxylase [Nitrospinota bacterium]